MDRGFVFPKITAEEPESILYNKAMRYGFLVSLVTCAGLMAYDQIVAPQSSFSFASILVGGICAAAAAFLRQALVFTKMLKRKEIILLGRSYEFVLKELIGCVLMLGVVCAVLYIFYPSLSQSQSLLSRFALCITVCYFIGGGLSFVLSIFYINMARLVKGTTS